MKRIRINVRSRKLFGFIFISFVIFLVASFSHYRTLIPMLNEREQSYYIHRRNLQEEDLSVLGRNKKNGRSKYEGDNYKKSNQDGDNGDGQETEDRSCLSNLDDSNYNRNGNKKPLYYQDVSVLFPGVAYNKPLGNESEKYLFIPYNACNRDYQALFYKNVDGVRKYGKDNGVKGHIINGEDVNNFNKDRDNNNGVIDGEKKARITSLPGTSVKCIKRGYQTKCYFRTIIVYRNKFYYVVKGEDKNHDLKKNDKLDKNIIKDLDKKNRDNNNIPNVLYLADGTTSALAKNHRYHGHRIEELTWPKVNRILFFDGRVFDNNNNNINITSDDLVGNKYSDNKLTNFPRNKFSPEKKTKEVVRGENEERNIAEENRPPEAAPSLISSSSSPPSSLLLMCRRLVTRPTVFLYRMSGHSTYHSWENNLGPLYQTITEDFSHLSGEDVNEVEDVNSSDGVKGIGITDIAGNDVKIGEKWPKHETGGEEMDLFLDKFRENVHRKCGKKAAKQNSEGDVRNAAGLDNGDVDEIGFREDGGLLYPERTLLRRLNSNYDDFVNKDEVSKLLIVYVDDKPTEGARAPVLLDKLLLKGFSDQLVNASRIEVPTCFTEAILGISSFNFNHRKLLRKILGNVLLSHDRDGFYGGGIENRVKSVNIAKKSSNGDKKSGDVTIVGVKELVTAKISNFSRKFPLCDRNKGLVFGRNVKKEVNNALDVNNNNNNSTFIFYPNPVDYDNWRRKRRQFLLRNWAKLPDFPRVLFISRNHPKVSRGRKIVNEDAVVEVINRTLESLFEKKSKKADRFTFINNQTFNIWVNYSGNILDYFDKIHMEDFSYEEQILIASRSNIIFSPHGGGVANCIWMPPGSVVMEFVAPVGRTLFKIYHAMCSKSGVTHANFLASPDPDDDIKIKNDKILRSNPRLFSNMIISQKLMEEQVKRAFELYNANLLKKYM